MHCSPSGGVALAALLALGACGTPAPVDMGAPFTPPRSTWLTGAKPTKPMGAACPVRFGAFIDTRSDPHEMGEIGLRPIHAADPSAWARSGFEALGRDPRIVVADPSASDAVVLEVEILKAYMLALPTTKSVNLVFRVHYSGRGGDTARVYRGVDTDMNWNSGSDETQSSFNRALAQVVEAVDTDIVARCGS